MKVNAHDGEGKKVAKKEKMVADGSKVSDNTFKMEIDSLKSFKKRKSQWLKHFQKEFWKNNKKKNYVIMHQYIFIYEKFDFWLSNYIHFRKNTHENIIKCLTLPYSNLL